MSDEKAPVRDQVLYYAWNDYIGGQTKRAILQNISDIEVIDVADVSHNGVEVGFAHAKKCLTAPENKIRIVLIGCFQEGRKPLPKEYAQLAALKRAEEIHALNVTVPIAILTFRPETLGSIVYQEKERLAAANAKVLGYDNEFADILTAIQATVQPMRQAM